MRPSRRTALLAGLAAAIVGGARQVAFAKDAVVPTIPGAANVALASHPSELYRLAAAALREGRRDEATLLFYLGQLRARIHLMARPDLPKSGDPALFASLNEVVGRPVNEWAFGDVPQLARILDRVLAWHAANDDPFTPKAQFAEAHRKVADGLQGLRDQIVAQNDMIRAQRTKNGLTNRN